MAYSVISKSKIQAINGLEQLVDAISGVADVRSVTFRDRYDKQCPLNKIRARLLPWDDYAKHKIIREATLLMGWGAGGSGIPYNSRVPLFFPRIQKI